jgi:ERCC4-type nuclease
MIVAVDTQEQTHGYAYRFPCDSVVKHLKTGDYSILGMEDRVTVERKALGDAYQTFSHGRERFERELERMSNMDYSAVVIESTLEGALFEPEVVSQMRAKSFNRSWIAWAQRYNVHFIWAGSRELAERITYIILERFNEEAQKGSK